jgi:hypothetical protein
MLGLAVAVVIAAPWPRSQLMVGWAIVYQYQYQYIYIYISIIFLCPPKLHGWYIKRKFQPGTFGTERYQKIMMRAGVMHI